MTFSRYVLEEERVKREIPSKSNQVSLDPDGNALCDNGQSQNYNGLAGGKGPMIQD